MTSEDLTPIFLLVLFVAITATTITPACLAEGTRPVSKCDLRKVKFSALQNPWRKIGKVANTIIEYTPDPQDFDPQEFDKKNESYSYLYLGQLSAKTPNTPSPCEISVNLVSSVYLAVPQQVLLTTSWSGSEHFLNWIDAKTCKQIFSAQGYMPKIVIKKNRASMSAECERGNPCLCSAVQIFQMDSNCYPTFLEEESKKATQKNLGVSFVGTKNVFNPKTKKAYLASEENPQNP